MSMSQTSMIPIDEKSTVSSRFLRSQVTSRPMNMKSSNAKSADEQTIDDKSIDEHSNEKKSVGTQDITSSHS